VSGVERCRVCGRGEQAEPFCSQCQLEHPVAWALFVTPPDDPSTPAMAGITRRDLVAAFDPSPFAGLQRRHHGLMPVVDKDHIR
jgi:hypothetical protein